MKTNTEFKATEIRQRTSSDCLRCCIATFFGFNYEGVPDFLARYGTDWSQALQQWSKELGYKMLRFRAASDGELVDLIIDENAEWMADGPTHTRGTEHAVLFRGHRMEYDPHPSQDGLAAITGITLFIKE